jgi:inner membrane protein
MDPLAHTLVGAALAETPLNRAGGSDGHRERIPLGTATLLLGANLPDVDVFLYFVGPDTALAYRRGWTHGVLAMALLPLLLTAGVLVWDRVVRRRRHPERAPASPAAILGLAYLALLTHPALDWLNTYGVRLLMPFDGRWFYGDSLFIIDIWLWLALGGAVFLARRPRGRELVLWITVAVLTSLLVLGAPRFAGIDPTIPKILWSLGLATVLGLRLSDRPSARARRRLAGFALGALVLYLAVSVVSTLLARRLVLDELARRGLSLEEPSRDLMVGPVPFDPFVRDVVARVSGGYRTGRFRWLQDPRLELTAEIPRVSRTPGAMALPFDRALAAAQTASCIRGFLIWVRFPYAEVEPAPAGSGHDARVFLMDARYTRRRTSGFGGAVVDVDEDGHAECPGGPS